MEEKRLAHPYAGWDVVRLIGRGSFGAVYELNRRLSDGSIEKAAMKVISIPAHEAEVDALRNLGYDDAVIQNHFKVCMDTVFQEYALIRGRANVVHCDDIRYAPHADGIGWDVFVKMELLTPINQWQEPLRQEAEVLRLGRDLCQALLPHHEQGRVHGDISNSAIFVSDSGYKLGDFGLNYILRHYHQDIVTPRPTDYLAPEVMNNRKYDQRSDIYSLGIVLYWLLNERRHPFYPMPPQNITMAEVEAARFKRFSGVPIPPPLNGSQALKAIVCKACAFDPQDRYQNAGEMLTALNAISAPAEWEDDPYEKTYRLSWHPQKLQTAPVQTPVQPVSTPAPEVKPEKPVSVDPMPTPAENPKDPKRKKSWPYFLIAGVIVILAVVALWVSSLYTKAWVPQKVVYTDGTTIKFSYNKKGQLDTMSATYSGDSSVKQRYFYDHKGNRDYVITYRDGEEYQRWDYTYADGFLAETLLTVYENGKEVTRCMVYTRDEDGNILRAEMYDENDCLIQTHTYEYDRSGRCTSRTEESVSTGATTRYDYTYDRKGNLLSHQRSFNGAVMTSYSFGYDADGYLIQRDLMAGETVKSSTDFIYDGDGNLIRVESNGKTLCTISYGEKRMTHKVFALLDELLSDWMHSTIFGIE